MFYQTAVQDYRAVNAPKELKERVITAVSKKKAPLLHPTLMRSLVACAAVVILCIAHLMIPAPQPHVTFVPDAQMLSYVGVTRNTEQYAIVQLEADGAIVIQTNAVFYIPKDNGLTPIGTRYRTKTAVSLYWPVSAGSASFTVNGVHYTLTADSQNGNLTLVQD